jgi:hypothetical protein
LIISYHQRAELAIQSYLLHYWNQDKSCIKRGKERGGKENVEA